MVNQFKKNIPIQTKFRSSKCRATQRAKTLESEKAEVKEIITTI